jgi:hypothetical protein
MCRGRSVCWMRTAGRWSGSLPRCATCATGPAGWPSPSNALPASVCRFDLPAAPSGSAAEHVRWQAKIRHAL